MSKIFLSYKQQFVTQANALHDALKIGVPGATVFQMADIDRGVKWREAVDDALDDAKCFVLLYASPEQDWSWCFYEAGRFSRKGRTPRPVACLHPRIVGLPSPLADLQSMNETPDDIRKWLNGSFFRGVRTRKPTKGELDESVEAIERLVSGTLAGEHSLKPYIWIAPNQDDDWSELGGEHDIDFSNAHVEIDPTSARSLGFGHPPTLRLLPFLREISCDTSEETNKVEFWITKFFESLHSAVHSKTNFQEEAYFRHESGKILRPVVVGYARSAKGTVEGVEHHDGRHDIADLGLD